ncbi:MAG: ABC transporter permease [Tissierellia bacterium]|nr:ABC transporter permease [Tissierellia bacterium]
MNRFNVLLNGELIRLRRYNLFAASLFVSAIWVGIIHFLNVEDVTTIVPQLIFLDVTTMATLLVGVSFIYEKDESTIRTMLVAPISKNQYLLAKLIANIIPSILSLTIMYLYSKLIKTIEINYFLLLGAVALVSFFHSLMGILLTYFTKDFTNLIMVIMLLFIILILPVILVEFNIITNEIFAKGSYILPSKAALMVIMGTARIIDRWEIIFSLIYLIGSCLVLYYLVHRQFDLYALRERGE